MTKLLEWLSVFTLLGAAWLSVVFNTFQSDFVERNYKVVLFSPVIFVLLFGIYAASVVLYRVFTFNNCEEAAKELQEEIIEAKEELQKLGLKFKIK